MPIDERARGLIQPFQEAVLAAKVAEKMDQRVKHKDLAAILGRALAPHHQRVSQLTSAVGGISQSLTQTDLSLAAINELLIEKGLYTAEEFNAKEADVTKRFIETTSPAKEAAEAIAEGTVQRLVEGPTCDVGACPNESCTCATNESETASRRLVEG